MKTLPVTSGEFLTWGGMIEGHAGDFGVLEAGPYRKKETKGNINTGVVKLGLIMSESEGME